MPTLPLPISFKLKVAVALACVREDISYIRHYRRNRSTHPGLKTVLKDLNETGYHVLRNCYDRAACAEIRSEIDSLVANYPDRIEVDSAHSDHRIWGGERASEQVRAFHDDPTLATFAKAYLKTDVGNMTTLAAKVVAKPNNLGSGGGWHRDSMYEKQIKAILYLSDVSDDNGPFQYVVGSNTKASVLRTLDLHHGANLKRFLSDDLEPWCQRHQERIETITGSAGDVILVDTRGLHRGKPIVSETRYALTNYYSAAHRVDELAPDFRKLAKF